MNDIFQYSTGKLYTKAGIDKWALPDIAKQQIQYDTHEYFLLLAIKNEEQKNLRLSVYPVSSSEIFFLEVRMDLILPEILQKVIDFLKSRNHDIITSTGICSREKMCFFGIFFTGPVSNGEYILNGVKSFNRVSEVHLYNYTCEGYCEFH